MRRNYQRMPQGRNTIKNNSKVNLPIIKQKQQKYNGIVENSKAINQAIELSKTKITKELIKDLLTLAFVILLFISILLVYNRNPEDKRDDVILRNYKDILKQLDEVPEDISSNKYEANVPSVIQKDIDKMLKMGEDACIIYYNDRKDQIIIEPSESSEFGYVVSFQESVDPYSVISIDELKSNISFYKSGNKLIVYGTSLNIRHLSSYSIDQKGLHYESLDNPLIDLYGTNISFDESRYFNDYATLIKNGNEFSIYHSGNLMYSTVFEGGEIADWDYYYLSTTAGDCYNVYYSITPQESWVKFYKVAENVDEILEDERISIIDNNGYTMEFPMFKIGDKKYAQIPNAEAERAYGQNFGRNNINGKDTEIDFTAQLVEISAINSSRVELVSEYITWRGNNYEWFLYYYFETGNRECFVKRRINGLDSNVSKKIPQDKLDMFNHKTISPDETEKYINQLRSLYDEYTDNTF